MIQLEQEGLVSKGKDGWFVSEVVLKDISELYDLRKIIEGQAGKMGCVHCPKEIRDEMAAVVRKLEEKSDQLETWRELNRRFHELIVLSCDNSKIHEVFVRTLKRLRWCSHVTLRVPRRKIQAMAEHRKILRAFLGRDRQVLEEAIYRHITAVQNLIKNKEIDPTRFAP